ncbi:transposase [Nostoc sp. ChiQUE01b]|uniref:transposase n=1 Tax=Nostoc sp. ChiQUE01b TaxID=3075376 RepID=UPI002AD51B6F|nr:transposase [Nostoc sp. ChiQUE01b]MDZ8264699.1 transposase [Nostoc sp. ChiQUE01b]
MSISFLFKPNPKKKTFRSTQAITESGQQKRLDYWTRIRGVEPDNLIFMDEMGVLLGLELTCSRSLRGQRAYTLKPFYRGTKITVIGAITNQGVLAMQTMPGFMKGDDFRTFMQNKVVPKLELGKVVVMDNLPAHKVKGIEVDDYCNWS